MPAGMAVAVRKGGRMVFGAIGRFLAELKKVFRTRSALGDALRV